MGVVLEIPGRAPHVEWPFAAQLGRGLALVSSRVTTYAIEGAALDDAERPARPPKLNGAPARAKQLSVVVEPVLVSDSVPDDADANQIELETNGAVPLRAGAVTCVEIVARPPLVSVVLVPTDADGVELWPGPHGWFADLVAPGACHDGARAPPWDGLLGSATTAELLGVPSRASS